MPAIQYDSAGKPYTTYTDHTGRLVRSYIPPWMLEASRGDLANVPHDQHGGLIHTRPQWNSQTGKYETPIDWGNVLALGTGAALTGGALAAAGGAGTAGGAGATAAGAGTGTGAGVAGTTAAGLLPSTTIGTGFIPAVGGASSLAGATSASGGILGALGQYGRAASDTGEVLSGAAGGLAEGRRIDAYTNAQNAPYNRDLPSVRTDQVARGEVLNTMQDAPLTNDPRIDKFAGGGLRPSAFGPNSRAAGAELSRTALAKLMHPEQDQIQPSHAGAGENALGTLGFGSSIFGLLNKYGRR